ncbi:MAG: stalk domain-containing protein [Lawsonibacter sp.]
MKNKFTALVLSGALICTMGVPTLAAEAIDSSLTPPSSQEEVQPLPHSVLYYGTVTSFDKDDTGAITRISLDSERYGAYTMNLSDETVWIDSGKHTASDPTTLQVGEGIYVFHSPVATDSLPPQSAAYAIVRSIPQDAGCAMYQVAESVSVRDDGSLAILTDLGGLVIYAGADTQVSAYDANHTASLDEIQEGTKFMVWYNVVLESYPGQTYATHIMILPEQANDSETPEDIEDPATLPAEGDSLTMELDGKVPNMVGRYENGTAMVPVAAVAQALGFQVTYNPNHEQGTLVTVESDTFAVNLFIDQELVYGATKIEGAVGMTGPQDYGKAPYIVSPGVTWAPAELFQMLGKTVTLEGTNLIIE